MTEYDAEDWRDPTRDWWPWTDEQVRRDPELARALGVRRVEKRR